MPLLPAFARLSRWGRLVTASAVVVLGSALIMAVWGLASSEKRVATFEVVGALSRISLDVDGADVVIVGGGNRPAVVRRTERVAFGHTPRVRRDAGGGGLEITSRCPRTPFGLCSAEFRVTVPSNVPVMVRTGSGSVRLRGFEGSAQVRTGAGDVDVSGFCGTTLEARADTGDVGAAAVCPPERVVLRSSSGDVRAVAPQARYRIEADSDRGSATVRGLQSADDAPFMLQALSGSGDVRVEERR